MCRIRIWCLNNEKVTAISRARSPARDTRARAAFDTPAQWVMPRWQWAAGETMRVLSPAPGRLLKPWWERREVRSSDDDDDAVRIRIGPRTPTSRKVTVVRRKLRMKIE